MLKGYHRIYTTANLSEGLFRLAVRSVAGEASCRTMEEALRTMPNLLQSVQHAGGNRARYSLAARTWFPSSFASACKMASEAESAHPNDETDHEWHQADLSRCHEELDASI